MTRGEGFVEGTRVLAVPAAKAAELIRRLHAHRLIDRTVKIGKRDGQVLVPVVAEPPFELSPYDAQAVDNPGLVRRSLPRDRIRERLLEVGIEPDRAPRGWERIGDVLVIRIPPLGQSRAHTIAEIYGTVLGARTVVEDVSGIHGPLRVPDIRVLWGNGTETIHVEGGVRYALDVAHVMLSSGNMAERLGIATRIGPGAVVVDLFAGIGYFTLPIALRGRAETVYACELNPRSFAYLVRNVRANRAHNVIPLLGDCRNVAPHGLADWVIMGHFHARDYLDVAFRALRRKGTIVYHELCPKEQYPDALTRRLAASARANWMNVNSMQTRIVKSYAPGIVHAAAEVKVVRQTRP